GEWKHWVSIVKPATVTSNVAFLMITGGDNDGRPRQRLHRLLPRNDLPQLRQ
ncbi:MAG: PhoPQ-activated protein PqaA family protein, partial [Acidobacteriota bacterium]